MVEKEAFTVVGRLLHTRCLDGEQLREIPKFWERCDKDGTVERLIAAGAGRPLLGVCLDMQPGPGEFTYMIAAEADIAPEGMAKCSIPASTWAVFTSVGPMPHAIQDVIARIFQEWFPATGYEHAGTPEIELYLPGDTTAADYRCEVWIPVVAR